MRGAAVSGTRMNNVMIIFEIMRLERPADSAFRGLPKGGGEEVMFNHGRTRTGLANARPNLERRKRKHCASV